MTGLRRLTAATISTLAATAIVGCGGPPVYRSDPTDPPDEPRAEDPPRSGAAFGEGVLVRVGLHWEKGHVRLRAEKGMGLVVDGGRPSPVSGPRRMVASARGGGNVRLAGEGGGVLYEGPGPVTLEGATDGSLVAGEMRVRGRLELSAKSETLFVVNVVPLEDYLRGVVPREIGPRPASEREAVAAQAVAARTYTVRKLDQYPSVPFDLFASVLDQVYVGIDGENAVADDAIRETRGLVLSDGDRLIEAFYSSTCGGRRSDIEAVWPYRTSHGCLRGGPDGDPGREWCRESPHFRWTESWNGDDLTTLVRRHLPEQLELSEMDPSGVAGDLVDLEVTRRGPSGRIAELEYVTTRGRWKLPGDRNRWILRRPGGGILRSVQVELDVTRREGRVVRVTARGQGNGHGVGMCQMGAIGRARAGQGFREILRDYYPGARVRTVGGSDLPAGRAAAS